MAGANPVNCGGSTYYEITCCGGNVPETGLITGSVPLGVGPITQSSKFNSNYTLNVAGRIIPIVRTNRDFSLTVESSLGQPTSPLRGIYSEGTGIYGAFCGPFGLDIYSTNISENCVIEKSTIHYLDLRYGVCLYKYAKETVVFQKSVSGSPSTTDPPHLSTACSTFQGPYGREIYWKAVLNMNDIPGECFEEWRLIVDGVEKILSHVDYTKYPVSERIISSVTCGGADKTGEIIIYPAPGLYSNPVDCDVNTWGWYKNGQAPGTVNFFYPDWCKALHVDPIWDAAEQSRISAVDNHQELPPASTMYIPPALAVDPIPVGSFVRHPVIGDVYQWLITTYGESHSVVTSPDLTSVIDKSLPDNNKTHDATLYYPISMI